MSKPNHRRGHRRTPDEIDRLLRAYDASGLSRAVSKRDRAISVRSFDRRSRRLAQLFLRGTGKNLYE
jgi:hypothetical protein